MCSHALAPLSCFPAPESPSCGTTGALAHPIGLCLSNFLGILITFMCLRTALGRMLIATTACGLADAARLSPASSHANSVISLTLTIASRSSALAMQKSSLAHVLPDGLWVGSSELTILASAAFNIGAAQLNKSSGSCWKSPAMSQGPLASFASSIALLKSKRFLSVCPSLCHRYIDITVIPHGNRSCIHSFASLPFDCCGEQSTSPFLTTPALMFLGVAMATPADLPSPFVTTTCAPNVFHPFLLACACASAQPLASQWCS